MTGIRFRASQLSLSVTGILAVVLVIGTAWVPQQLRADMASRIVGLTQYFDATVAGAWHSAFPSRGSGGHSVTSASYKDGGSNFGTPFVLTEIEAPPSNASGAGNINRLSPEWDAGRSSSNYGAGLPSKGLQG